MQSKRRRRKKAKECVLFLLPCKLNKGIKEKKKVICVLPFSLALMQSSAFVIPFLSLSLCVPSDIGSRSATIQLRKQSGEGNR